jgi:hypothetical protein
MRFYQGLIALFLTLTFSAQAAELNELIKRVSEEVTHYEVQHNIACIMVDNSYGGSMLPMEGVLEKHGIAVKYFCKEAGNPEANIQQVLMTLIDTKVKLFSNRPIENYELTVKSQKLKRKH